MDHFQATENTYSLLHSIPVYGNESPKDALRCIEVPELCRQAYNASIATQNIPPPSGYVGRTHCNQLASICVQCLLTT